MRERFVHYLRLGSRSPIVHFVCVLGLYKLSWFLFYVIAQLPEGVYRGSSIALGMSESLPLVVFLVVNLGVMAGFSNRLAWDRIDPRRHSRWFIMVPVAIMTWSFSAYDYNFYYDQGHVIDRLLLIALAACVWFHPLFVHLWFILMMAIASQVHYPLAEYHWYWADKRLLLDFFILLHCFLYVRLVVKIEPYVLLLLILALTGGSYFYAGWSKLALGPSWYSWLVDDRLSNILVAAYVNGGWLRPLGDAGAIELAHTIGGVERILAFLTLGFELGAALLLVSRRVGRFMVIAFVIVHLSILATTGIGFWKWCIFDLALLLYWQRVDRDYGPTYLVTRGPPPAVRDADWRPRSRVALAAVITLAIVFPRAYGVPTGFGWFDSKIVNYFEFEAIAASGRRYILDPRFFAPYDLLFQQSRFYFLVDRPVLASTYGVVYDHALALRLESATVDDLDAIRLRHGRRAYDPERSRRFARFIRRFVENAEHRRSHRLPVLGWLAPPYHFQTFLPDDVYTFQEPLIAVEVRFHELFYDGRGIRPVTEVPVLRVELEGR